MIATLLLNLAPLRDAAGRADEASGLRERATIQAATHGLGRPRGRPGFRRRGGINAACRCSMWPDDAIRWTLACSPFLTAQGVQVGLRQHCPPGRENRSG
jgi:hypothetical protein